MQIIIDMDGTICQEMRTYSRCLAEPKPGAIEGINRLYDAGNTIIIYSARTWMEWEMTTAWLKGHGVKYHQLMMGKPVGDVWIDDRAMHYDNNWDEITKKLLEK
jgi:hypothetical protein